MKVSLCIPTYNLEDKIEKCLESLVNQTMDSKEYEIIIIDDCSKDKTLKVAEEVLKDSGFKNYHLEALAENSGHASKPRNRSMELAKGEYIYFIDGDDFLYPEALERMYTFGKDNDSDLIVGKYKGINRGVPQDMFRHKEDIVDGQIVEHRFMWTLSVLKMFKRSELERLNLKFDQEEAVGEDMLFTTAFLANTKRHSIVGTYDCYACVGHESDHLSKRPRTTETYLGMQKKIIKVIDEGTCFTDKEKLEAKAKLYARTLVIGKNNSLYDPENYIDLNTRDEWLKELKAYTEEYIDIEVARYLAGRERQMYYAIIYGDMPLLINIVAEDKKQKQLKKELNAATKKINKLEKKIEEQTNRYDIFESKLEQILNSKEKSSRRSIFKK